MANDYGFFDWLSDMENFGKISLSELPWRLLSFAVCLFIISIAISLFLCIWRSLRFDIATKDDIIQDRRHCPNSWFYGEDYEKVNLTKIAALTYMLRANLSYRTFWNVCVMDKWRICGSPFNRIYFRVNRFGGDDYIKRIFILFSLSFVWGYIIFLIIAGLRLIFCKKPLC